MYKIQMDKLLFERWIEALREGKYKQGQQELCTPLNFKTLGISEKIEDCKYCCLGVLAHLIDNSNDSLAYCGNIYDKLNIKGQIPYELLEEHSLASKLIEMNDQEEKSLIEIADWLEENVVIDEQ